jgi:outer membrane protein assembly factor BamB
MSLQYDPPQEQEPTMPTRADAYVRRALILLALGIACAVAHSATAQDASAVAAKLLGAEGVRQGICAHIGCGDGTLTAELHMGGRYLVHGVDRDAARVARARDHIRGKGLYGDVSVSYNALKRLPYCDDVVNVLIVSDLPSLLADGLTVREALRVVAPYGSAFFGGPDVATLRTALADADVKQFDILHAGGVWARVVKPYPQEMDEWPQFLYDASGAGISRDKLVGPTTGLRWMQGPFWSVLGTPVQSVLSAHGRTFYVKSPMPRDGGGGFARVVATPGNPYVLEARDAFNGLLLWQRPIHAEPLSPARRQSLTIAVGDRIYTRLKAGEPLVALDATTGEVVKTYDVGGPVAYHQGVLIVRESGSSWTVLDPQSGKRLRTFALSGSSSASPLIIAGGRALAIEVAPASVERPRPSGAPRTRIVCFDFDTAKVKWRAPNVADGSLYWCRRGMVLTYTTQSIHAFSAEDGRHLWANPMTTKKGGFPSAFYLGDAVWAYGKARWYYEIDPQTGAVRKGDPGRWKEFGRCGPDRATEKYVLGMDFSIYDLSGRGTWDTFFARADCGTGYIPANGMYYQYGQVCRCGTYLTGILGVSSAPLTPMEQMRARAGEPLEKGPAYGAPSAAEGASSADWPTYRHDAFRSGATTSAIPAALRPLWRVKVGRRSSAAVIADQTAFVADIDGHRVLALDTRTGRRRWSYTAGGRVDSPPTVESGRVLFGARDGWVYCLRADDGRLIWRFRAAPEDRLISVRGQLESVWPVFGAVLVEDGPDGTPVAYFAAGRHGDADGGVLFYAVDPSTGAVLWQEHIFGYPPYRTDPHIRLIEARKPIPKIFDAEKIKAVKEELLAGIGRSFRNDVLLSNGKTIFLSSIGLDPAARTVIGPPQGKSIYTAGASFLSDNTLPGYPGRNEWTYEGNLDKPAWREGKRTRPQGSLIALDERKVYVVKHSVPRRGRSTPTMTLSANPRDPREVKTEGKRAQPWSVSPHVERLRGKALIVAGDTVFIAGQPGGMQFGSADVRAGSIWAFDAETGRELAVSPLGCEPAFDGLAAAGGRLFVATRDGEMVCMGPVFSLLERNWTFDSGARVTRTLAFHPDAAPQYPFELNWTLSVGDKVQLKGGRKVATPAQLPEKIEIALTMPVVAARTEGEFVLTWRHDGKDIFRDVAKLQVVRADVAPKPKLLRAELAVWDSAGTVKKHLSARGVAFTEVTGIDRIPDGMKVLVVGAGMTTHKQLQDPAWRALTHRGLRVLVLEQASYFGEAILGADVRAYGADGRLATLERPEHPALAGLRQRDFAEWAGDGIVHRTPYRTGKKAFRSLARPADGRGSVLAEFPLDDGLIIVCQLAIGRKLSADPTARRLFDNLLTYCAGFTPRLATTVLPAADPRTAMLGVMDLKCDTSASVLAAISDGRHNVVVADASPANLRELAEAPDKLEAFTGRGGWLMLWGLTPRGLADYNRIVGVDHILRPFAMEKVAVASSPHPLLVGLSDADLAITTNERMQHRYSPFWVADDAFSYVVDLDDIAPFCHIPGPEHWGMGKISPKSNVWPQNMVNGFVTSDYWKYAFYMPTEPPRHRRWTLQLPRQEDIVGFSIHSGGAKMHDLKTVRLVFDGDETGAARLTVQASAKRQDFPIPAHKATRLTIDLSDLDLSGTNDLLLVSNIWIQVKRPATFYEKTRPLTNIGVLVNYPKGPGGVTLNQLRLLKLDEIDAQVRAAGDQAEKQAAAGKQAEARAVAEKAQREHLRGNADKKRKIVRQILWNLGLESR